MNKPTREDAIQAILTEVDKGYTIDEAVERLTAPPKKQSEAFGERVEAVVEIDQRIKEQR